MKKCNKCGQISEDNMKFCRYCGGNEFSDMAENSSKPKGKKPVILIVLLLLIAVSAVCVVLLMNKDDNKGKENPPKEIQVEEKADNEQIDNAENEKEELATLTESETTEKKPNLIKSMGKAEQREVNIFLSNFSEADYMRRNTDGEYV